MAPEAQIPALYCLLLQYPCSHLSEPSYGSFAFLALSLPANIQPLCATHLRSWKTPFNRVQQQRLRQQACRCAPQLLRRCVLLTGPFVCSDKSLSLALAMSYASASLTRLGSTL